MALTIGKVVSEPSFWANVRTSSIRVLLGFCGAFLIGSLFGLLMGSFNIFERALKPYLVLSLTVPALCWVVIAILLFGLTEFTVIFVITAITAPIISVNFISGVKELDRDLIDMAKVYKIGKATVLKQIIIPQLTPYAMSATRLGLALSWKVLVIIEMLGGSNGVGYQIVYWFNMFSMERVIAWTLIFSMIMLSIEYIVLRPIEGRLTHWRNSNKAKNYERSHNN
ncbi:ABC transporter permease [Teredinibacter turnerae]|uniref:ABC transporter permease n=1 Tax=Teredinibacter turnerae TaxID=2426 RepID=UPI0013C44011|nr:ABC transporter permease [Teredinibacter turnerae]